MEIRNASFVKSSSRVEECPMPECNEYAFIGRSNVGKSSLINMLTNNSNLAKTSSTPGKTQLINHFIINEEWFLVDLPGYGYARTSKSFRDKFEKMITDYILKRENLVCLFVLIDSRHEPMKIDLEFMEWLGENGAPFVMVFTKGDKLSTRGRSTCIDKYAEVMNERWEDLPMSFMTSASKKLGKNELIEYISELNNTIEV